ncbi:MAG TPA: HAMP domain-containing sensor histidine kinase [Edaphocola sp.]|nr:HAMP domain-containing sensor histidine kinase [Edaphocola sp.]
MTLKNRFTLISSLSFGIVTIAAFIVIFIAFYDSSKNENFKTLRNTVLVAAIYYLEKDELPEFEHAEIQSEYRSLIESHRVAIYNENNQVAFGKLINDKNITTQHLNSIRKNKHTQFLSKNNFYYGIYYPDNQGNFVVFVKASNEAFKSQIVRLLIIMISVLLLGLLTIYILSRYLSHIVYKPVINVVKQVKNANCNDISTAISSTHTNDEIGDLVKTYNDLLNRIAESILIQKNFINYASHELKTPLAAILGTMQVFAQKDRSPEEYQEVTQKVSKEVFHIEDILNNLLLISGIKQFDEQLTKIRIDELIWDIVENKSNIKSGINPLFNINIDIKKSSLLEIKSNPTLLQLALFNIIENAIKYSHGKEINIHLFEENNNLKITIEDSGPGIPKENMEYIFNPFYRGKNIESLSGNGSL